MHASQRPRIHVVATHLAAALAGAVAVMLMLEFWPPRPVAPPPLPSVITLDSNSRSALSAPPGAARSTLPDRLSPAIVQPGTMPRGGGLLDVIDGDTVRYNGAVYRLVGFDTPERGDLARCADERRRADLATSRLRELIAGGAMLTRVSCSCRSGTEGTPRCNYGRLCGTLTVGGRDVGEILIGEGLAHPYVCSRTGCPPRRGWC